MVTKGQLIGITLILLFFFFCIMMFYKYFLAIIGIAAVAAAFWITNKLLPLVNRITRRC